MKSTAITVIKIFFQRYVDFWGDTVLSKKSGEDCSPPPDTLCVNQFFVCDFHCPIPNVVHPLYPQLLILGLELLHDALTDGKLFYQLKKHVFRLLIQIGKITVQLAGDLQLCVHRLLVLSEIPQMPLTPNANGPQLFIGELQTGNVIIALKLVPKPVLLVVDVLLHDVILQIRLIPAIQSLWLITKARREATSLRSASIGSVSFFICSNHRLSVGSFCCGAAASVFACSCSFFAKCSKIDSDSASGIGSPFMQASNWFRVMVA